MKMMREIKEANMTHKKTCIHIAIIGIFCLILCHSAPSFAKGETCDPKIDQGMQAKATGAAQDAFEVTQASMEATPSTLQLSCWDTFAQESAQQAGKVFSNVGAGAANLAKNVQQGVVASAGSYINSAFSSIQAGSFASITPPNFGSFLPNLSNFGFGSTSSPCNVMGDFTKAVRSQNFTGPATRFMDPIQALQVTGSRVPGAPGLGAAAKKALLGQIDEAGKDGREATAAATQTLIDQTSTDTSCGSITPVLSGLTLPNGDPAGSCSGGCTFSKGHCVASAL